MTEKLQVEYVLIDKLAPFAGNPRRNDEAVDSIVHSIERFGYTNPVLVRRANNEIIAGHTRVKAMQRLGETHVPVIYLDLSEADAHVYGLFDNKSVENTPWDFPKLAELLTELDGQRMDLELTGFGSEEIQDIAQGLAIDLDYLPGESGEKGLRALTVLLTEEQFTLVDRELKRAQKAGHGKDELNPNRNGNALYWLLKTRSRDVEAGR